MPAPPAPAKARLAAPEPAPAASKPTKPAPAARQAAAPVVSSAEAAAYQGAVLARISAQRRYPEAARERAPHGVAVIRFSIDASGQVAGLSLFQSAGDPILDAEALATVRRASPFPPPPAGAPRNFSAPLSFRVR
jgi:protein TonB